VAVLLHVSIALVIYPSPLVAISPLISFSLSVTTRHSIVFLVPPDRITAIGGFVNHHDEKPAAPSEATVGLRAADLCDVDLWFRERGCSEFEYDESLDVFRFPEDGRFAFCREFADWGLLEERGYLDF
jgi:hypothetical protein